MVWIVHSRLAQEVQGGPTMDPNKRTCPSSASFSACTPPWLQHVLFKAYCVHPLGSTSNKLVYFIFFGVLLVELGSQHNAQGLYKC